MKKTASQPSPDSILIENVGPIDRLEIKLQPGRVTLLTGNNGAGKSEALNAVNGLIGRAADVTLRDGATEGRVAGFGRQLKLTAKRNTATGELDILVVEEGFSIGGFVKPGFKTAEANDKQRLKNLASCLGIQIDKNAVYELVGGRDVYQSLVTDKTTDARDPADYVSCLKRDCDAQALELERLAGILEAEAETLEDTLPTETGESNAEKLSERLAVAMDAKRALVAKQDAAEQVKKLAESAQKVLEAGQGQTVEEAEAAFDELNAAVVDYGEMVEALRLKWLDARNKLETMKVEANAARKTWLEAIDRKGNLDEAKAQLNASAASPTEAEFELVDQAVKEAEAAVVLGHKLREAKEIQTKMDAKRIEASENRLQAETLRKAAASCLSLLVDPINKLDVGIAIDENMRLVVNGHKRGVTAIEELSEGERVSLAIQLVTRMSDDDAIMVLEQQFFESLDAGNRQILIDEVAKTQLRCVTAEACRNGSIDHVTADVLEP